MTILTVNGARQEIADADHRTLLEVLRDDLGLKGAKLGCGEGECGACTVLIDGRPVCACLQLAKCAVGREVTTIEAFAETELGLEITHALASAGAVQCGYCTPGFVMAAGGHFGTGQKGELAAALEGNLCRCTGYSKIRAALDQVSSGAGLRSRAVHRDVTLAGALSALAESPTLMPIAGGTDLLVRHEHDLAGRSFLDLTRIADAEMTTIREDNDDLVIGALVTWAEILHDSLIASSAPLLAQVAATNGGAQIRNAGTIGGNVATASPAADGVPALSALGAQVVVGGQQQRRLISLDGFVLGPGKTALGAGELIISVRIPQQSVGAIQLFRKVGPRRAQSIAKVSLALVGEVAESRLRALRIAFGAVGPVPMTCPRTTELLMSGDFTPGLRKRACQILEEEISPIDDHRSTKDYRRRTAARMFFDAVGSLLPLGRSA